MHISFEYFPPKDMEQLDTLASHTKQLCTFNPEFFSVTYGAGGSTQDRTLNTVLKLKETCGVDVAPHITCIGSTKERIRMLLKQYQDHGIHRLVVLRGDLPSGTVSLSHDFQYAYQLVDFIRKETGDHFQLEVAAYPEMHPETLNPAKHIQHLKQKIEAGANRIITQYFFNADAYFQLLSDANAAGIKAEIIPGIMPITNYTQLARFSRQCGAEIPRWLDLQLKEMADDLPALRAFGTAFMQRLCQQLIDGGAHGLHFYTLNKAQPSINILEGVRSYSGAA